MAEICERRLMTGTSVFQARACKRTQAVGEPSAVDPDLNILTHLPGKSCFVLYYCKGTQNIIYCKRVANMVCYQKTVINRNQGKK